MVECGNSHETLSYHPFATFCPVLRAFAYEIDTEIRLALIRDFLDHLDTLGNKNRRPIYEMC